MMEDIKWYLKTCHECQLCNMFKMHIPPTVPEPAPLFSKVHVDTMYMEKHGGYRYIAHARCSLSAWPEARALTAETGHTLGKFLMDELLCRWGGLSEIVSDNGKPWVAALDWLSATYHINHIRISPYNSQAQGIVERPHLTLRESLVKACEGELKHWPKLLPYCLWADRITTRMSTGHSPYFMAHGVEPLMPFDIMEATYLVPELNRIVSTEELIGIRARQLRKRPEDLQKMKDDLWHFRTDLARKTLQKYETTTADFDFKAGSLVLVRNSAMDNDLGKKWKPRYLGPYIVLKRSRNGAYRLAEMDGTPSKLRFAAKRVIPYYLRTKSAIPMADLKLENMSEEEDGVIDV